MFVKQARDMSEVRDILETIRSEDPGFWPYGLRADQFDGGLYLVSKSASAPPVGFVGWQTRQEGPKRIGYYSIGILPEHRQQRYAKAAVTQLLEKKAGEVDEVRAFIVRGNAPSTRLARSLGVQILTKEASKAKAVQLTGKAAKQAAKKAAARFRALRMGVGTVGGGYGSTVLMDQLNDTSRPLEESMNPLKWGEWDKERKLLGAANAVFGAGAGLGVSSGGFKGLMGGIASAGAIPIKEVALKGLPALGTYTRLSRLQADQLESPPSKLGKGTALAAGGGALALLAAGVLAHRRTKAMEEQTEAMRLARGGRVRVTLPTKDPNDNETLIDLPIEDAKFSTNLRGQLGRDVRRRLLAETRQRTKPRKPKDPTKPTEHENQLLELEKERQTLDKVATVLSKYASGLVVPTPPPMDVNPALRMTQEQMAAQQQSQAQTAANPQIEQANQQAAQAQQQSEQQAMELQQQQQMESQQTQQQISQMEAQHQQQLMEASNREHILQMKLEKEKAEKDLMKQQTKIQGGQKDGALTNRLSRIHRMLGKGASEESPDVNTPTPQPYKTLRPGEMQRMNDYSSGFAASGYGSPVRSYRTSYGRPLDAAFETFARPWLFSPRRQNNIPSGLDSMRQTALQHFMQSQNR